MTLKEALLHFDVTCTTRQESMRAFAKWALEKAAAITNTTVVVGSGFKTSQNIENAIRTLAAQIGGDDVPK